MVKCKVAVSSFQMVWNLESPPNSGPESGPPSVPVSTVLPYTMWLNTPSDMYAKIMYDVLLIRPCVA